MRGGAGQVPLRAKRGVSNVARVADATAEIPRRCAPRNDIRRCAAKYLAIGRVTMASQTAYLGEMALRSVFLGIVLFIFLQLWTATYQTMGRETIAGFTVAQMLWYLMLTESLILSRPRLTREVDAEVRSGDLAYQLIRPFDYVGYRLAVYLGERVLRLALCLVSGAGLAFALTGSTPISAAGLAGAALLAAIGMLIDFCGAMAIGLAAFWLEETQPLTLLYDRAIMLLGGMLLGGMLLPIELFPEPIAAVMGQLPFQLLLYAPARAAVSGDLSGLAGALVGGLVTLAAAYGMVQLVQARAVRRLHANGG
jgi:ABC-2 type transport system permease protein